jgi:uncharacterized membrane protein
MKHRELTLIGGAGALGLLTVAAEVAGAPKAALTVLGVLLVFLLPGYVTVCALVPGREFSWGERLLASLASSLAISTGTGVLLAAAPVGLSTDSAAVTLGSGVAAMSLYAWIRTSRRLREPPEPAGWARPADWDPRRDRPFRPPVTGPGRDGARRG